MKSRNSPLVLGFFAIVALVSTACAGVTRVAEPPYAIEFREGDLEVRKYGPRVVAETEVAGSFGDAGNEGFRRLAGYIFGKNKRRSEIAMTAPVAQASAPEPQKIAMTAPVAQRGSPSAWTVAFTMPAGETLATLPVPDDPRVVLRELAPVRVAVVRFSGRWTDENMGSHEVQLRTWVSQNGLPVAGKAEINRYDPPFLPWFARRNEIWLPLQSEPHG
jgi:hypothetical protein